MTESERKRTLCTLVGEHEPKMSMRVHKPEEEYAALLEGTGLLVPILKWCMQCRHCGVELVPTGKRAWKEA